MKCDKKGLLLYAVTDRSWLNGETLYSQVEKALQGGATFIQLREKNLDQDHFMEEALELKKLCAAYHVPFVINDNVEIAAKMDADGVHVGQSDMEAGDVRAKLGPDKIIGVSAQTVEQAILAEQRGADYLGVGAVFHTGSKADAEDVSHETLTAICNAVKIPVIAIGGITHRRRRRPVDRWQIFSAGFAGAFRQRHLRHRRHQCHFCTERHCFRNEGSERTDSAHAGKQIILRNHSSSHQAADWGHHFLCRLSKKKSNAKE